VKHDPGWDEELFGRLQVFVDQWKTFDGTEQAGAQQFLQGLLAAYDASFEPGTIFEQHPIRVRKPAKAVQRGLFGADDPPPQQTAERMDMYLPKVCVWEMKSPSEKDLGKWHNQILDYWARVRTRYMVLCNFREFWIYDTDEDNGQNQPKLRFRLEELPGNGDALLFLRGEEAHLERRSIGVTADIARMLGRIVREVVDASADPDRDRERISKFVLQGVFAMFAEDTDLLPPSLFTKAMERADRDGQLQAVWALFDDFARKDGVKTHPFAPYVNGPLFDRNLPKIDLTTDQIHDIHCAARDFDWRGVRPEIFGSIFEQALDPVLRHELGAHFTREEDILRVVGPTIISPWQQRIAGLRTPKDAERAVEAMKAYHVLDPACGCGNFLYVAYREMKRLEAALARKWVVLEHKVAKRRADIRPVPMRPWFTIQQLHGIEKNPFAAFLARVVLWIGEHLATAELGLDEETLPLKNLDGNVRHADALFTDWPRPDGELAIVSNPPYLGVRKLRQELGDEYVEKLFERFPVNRSADYVTYWFTKALEMLRPRERAGYVCTNSIAQNESREASIDRMLAAGGTITDAWRSYPWPGDAAVHIGIVNWVMAPYEGVLTLDGHEADRITPSLTSGANVSRARTIPENLRLSFMGVTLGNMGFVLDGPQRAEILEADPGSAAVIKPFLIGRDLNRETDQAPTRWVIDFGMMNREEAERYVGAFRHVQRHVYPSRIANKRESNMSRWWAFWRPGPDLREALKPLHRCMVLSRVTKHFILAFAPTDICFDQRLFVFALSDWYHFGILHSRLHETWGRSRGGTLEDRFAYTASTIFETFPFPPLHDGTYGPRVHPQTPEADRVAATAETFDRLRRQACRERNLGLTKIHNDLEAGGPPELRAAYDAMNDAVDAMYGFPQGTWRDQAATLSRLLDLNLALTAGTAPDVTMKIARP
jgi:hypothetical protein